MAREAPSLLHRRRSGRGTRIAAIVAPDERVAGEITEAFAATPIVPENNEPIAWGEAIGSLLLASRPSHLPGGVRTPWR
jgi:hypothetical protein